MGNISSLPWTRISILGIDSAPHVSQVLPLVPPGLRTVRRDEFAVGPAELVYGENLLRLLRDAVNLIKTPPPTNQSAQGSWVVGMHRRLPGGYCSHHTTDLTKSLSEIHITLSLKVSIGCLKPFFWETYFRGNRERPVRLAELRELRLGLLLKFPGLRWRWSAAFGYVIPADEESLSKIGPNVEVDRARPRGRPK